MKITSFRIICTTTGASAPLLNSIICSINNSTSYFFFRNYNFLRYIFYLFFISIFILYISYNVWILSHKNWRCKGGLLFKLGVIIDGCYCNHVIGLSLEKGYKYQRLQFLGQNLEFLPSYTSELIDKNLS